MSAEASSEVENGIDCAGRRVSRPGGDTEGREVDRKPKKGESPERLVLAASW